jgi:predicted nucleic acid-binding protein
MKTAYLDTTIFVEMATKRSKYRSQIRNLLEELKKDRVRIYTSMITVQELAVATYRAGAPARDVFSDINAFARVYNITRTLH